MNAKSLVLGLGIVYVLAIDLLLSGCGQEILKAVWLSPSYEVNGGPDWWNLPAFAVKDLSGRVVLANDSSTLYIGLYSSDRHIGRRLRWRGLTVWMTNPEDKTERIGIHYPIGMPGPGMRPTAEEQARDTSMPPPRAMEMVGLETGDLEILTNDSTRSGRKTHDEAQQLGMRAAFLQNESAAQYTLAVEERQIVPWLKQGSRVLLEIESPAMERFGGEGRERPEGGGRHREGTPPSEGGQFPHGGQHHRGESQREGTYSNKPIDFKCTVELATAPNAP
jgi:hypothetical protein